MSNQLIGREDTVEAVGFEDQIELRDYWRVLVRRRWLLLAVLVSVLAGVALQTFTTTPTYRSTAKVRIDPEAANVLPYQDIAEAPESYMATEIYMQTQYRVLESRSVAQRVIERLNLRDNPIFYDEQPSGLFVQVALSLASLVRLVLNPLGDEGEGPQEDLVERFLDRLEVKPIRNSRLVEVSYQSRDPEFASHVVNTLTEEFIEHNFETKYEATMRATDFLQRQLQGLKINVEGSEEELTRYARQHGILNIDERENIVLQKLADLNAEMTKVQAQLIGKTARYQIVEQANVEHFPPSLKNELILELEKRLSMKEQEFAILSSRFGPDWPEVKERRNEIEKVSDQLGREKDDVIRQARIEFQVAKDHYEMLAQALEWQKEMANRLNEDSIQYNILKREVETNKQLYEGLLQRLKEAGVSAGLKSSNIQIVDRGEIPYEPYRPRKALNLALGLIIGLMLGVGLAFVVEYMDNTVKTPDQVEHFLAIPSLGVIPRVRGLERLVLPATDANEDARLIPYEAGSRVWEAYRALRTSILLSSSGGQPRKVLVTSALSGEGKTTTATNVAITLSQTGARTLLIDLDMRKPMIARNFGIQNGGGVSTFLSGNSDLASQIHQAPVPNLYLLPSGPLPPNPAELLGSERMAETLNLLQEHFKYILIDSPPVLSVTDPVVLSPQVDGVVFVVRGGSTSRDAIRRATQQLTDVGARIVGAILNDVDIESSEYYYYYRDYYDYGYYAAERRG